MGVRQGPSFGLYRKRPFKNLDYRGGVILSGEGGVILVGGGAIAMPQRHAWSQGLSQVHRVHHQSLPQYSAFPKRVRVAVLLELQVQELAIAVTRDQQMAEAARLVKMEIGAIGRVEIEVLESPGNVHTAIGRTEVLH